MSAFSYSKYSTLAQCGQKFKLSYIDGVGTPSAAALEFGSAMHAGINTLLISKDVFEAQAVFEAYWRTSHPKCDFTGERYGAEYLESTGHKFLSNFHKRLAKDMTLIVGEERLRGLHTMPAERGFAISDVCEGTPDALVQWQGKNILLDFKTSAYNYDERKTDISLQLNLYAWLLEENGYKVDALCYLVFNKQTGGIQTPYIVAYDKKKALAMVGEALLTWNRNLGHYEKNPNACFMGKTACPHFDRCWK